MHMSVKVLSAFVLAGSLSQPASAVVVTFEDRIGPTNFAAAGPAQTLVYSFTGYTATFTGGVILTNETSQTTDNSSVYATAGGGLGGAGLANPLTITFSAPITNFQIDVLNAFAGNYQMADNAGHSINFLLATTGGSLQTVGFAASGSVVTIRYLDNLAPYGWDFAIDNVLFNQALTVPEPASLALMLFGLGMTVSTARRRKANHEVRRFERS